jgi:hypothetical protein
MGLRDERYSGKIVLCRVEILSWLGTANSLEYKREEMSVYCNCIYYDKFHMATCFDLQWVIFRSFELIALTKQL